jgi:hypothetical protein
VQYTRHARDSDWPSTHLSVKQQQTLLNQAAICWAAVSQHTLVEAAAHVTTAETGTWRHWCRGHGQSDSEIDAFMLIPCTRVHTHNDTSHSIGKERLRLRLVKSTLPGTARKILIIGVTTCITSTLWVPTQAEDTYTHTHTHTHPKFTIIYI